MLRPSTRTRESIQWQLCREYRLLFSMDAPGNSDTMRDPKSFEEANEHPSRDNVDSSPPTF